MASERDELYRRRKTRMEQQKRRKAAQRRMRIRLAIAAVVLLASAAVIFNLSRGETDEPVFVPHETQVEIYGQTEETTEESTESNSNLSRAPTVIHLAAAGDLNVTDRVVWSGQSGTIYDYTNAFMDVSPIFSEADLAFSGVDFRSLTMEQMNLLLGETAKTSSIVSENEEILTAEWQGAYMSADVLSVADGRVEGPRGIRTGDSLDQVLAAFHSDGEGRIYGSQAILYGDGLTAPNGILERDGDWASVSYTARMDECNVTLMLTFSAELLEEWMIYTW